MNYIINNNTLIVCDWLNESNDKQDWCWCGFVQWVGSVPSVGQEIPFKSGVHALEKLFGNERLGVDAISSSLLITGFN